MGIIRRGFYFNCPETDSPKGNRIAINPQTNILDYEVVSAVNKFIKVVFKKEEQLLSQQERSLLTLKDFLSSGQKHAIDGLYIVQNRFDEHHFHEHLVKNLEWDELSLKNGWNNFNGVETYIFEDERGHVGETPEVVQAILDHLDSI